MQQPGTLLPGKQCEPGDFPTCLVLGGVGRGERRALGRHAGMVCWESGLGGLSMVLDKEWTEG